MKLGEERPVAELGHEHPHDFGTEGLDELAHEVVAHGAGRLDALKSERDGGRLGPADEDRQRTTSAFRLFEQHDWGTRPQVDSYGPQVHLDHDSNLPP